MAVGSRNCVVLFKNDAMILILTKNVTFCVKVFLTKPHIDNCAKIHNYTWKNINNFMRDFYAHYIITHGFTFRILVMW